MILALKIAFLEISWVDFIDISLVAVLLYQAYKLIKGSIAFNIFIGILALYFIYLTVRAANMELLTTILGQFMGIGMLATLILFQQEIRKFLLVIGKTTEINRETLVKPFVGWHYQQRYNFDVHEITGAIKVLKATQTGGLIVFSKDSELKFHAETGDLINSIVSKRLLIAIFNKSSPLHDGAVIIYKGRITAARCVLPVSENQNMPSNYGLRHRAAIGMSESTDSLIIAVSEETGNVLMARSGLYIENLTLKQVGDKVLEYLDSEATKTWDVINKKGSPSSIPAT